MIPSLVFAAIVLGAPKSDLDAGFTAICSGGNPESVLYLAEGRLRAWPGDTILWTAVAASAVRIGGETVGTVSTLPTALACEDDLAAIGVAEPGETNRGKLLLFARDASGWKPGGEIDAHGVPRALLLGLGRLAAVIENHGSFSIAILPARPGAKVQKLILPGKPTGLALSPSGEEVLVAVGTDLRSFKIADGRTWMIFPFPEPIGAVAGKPGIARLLVAQGSSVVAVDPKDRATRGVLPVRIRVELPSPAAALAWTGEGRIAVALTLTPPRLTFLDGNNLSIIQQHEVGAIAGGIASLGDGRVIWLGGSRTGPVQEWALAPEMIAATAIPDPRRFENMPEPSAPPPAPIVAGQAPNPPAQPRSPSPPEPGSPLPVPTGPSPLEPKTPTAAAPPVQPESAAGQEARPPAPAPTPPAEKTMPSSAATAVEQNSPAGSEARPPSPAPTQPSPGKPAMPIAAVPPVKPESSAVPDARPPESVPAQPPHVEPTMPAAAAPPVQPKSAIASTSESSLPAALADSGVVPPAGTIVGRLDGRADLAIAIVVLGPDSLVSEKTRVKPSTTNAITWFSAADLPAGRYRVVPMGKGGATLACRPAFATITLTPGAGGRADFTIDGAY